MVIDSSAFVAILLVETEGKRFLDLIAKAERKSISAANAFEAAIVLEARAGEGAAREFDFFLYEADVKVVPVDSDMVAVARIAWRRYGKGRHPAALNFGDCFAYALAKISGEPLLAKGDDFLQTDIELC
jgi:ribonuclease VapC